MRQAAKILIYDNQQRILVLRRSQTHPLFAHHLDFPGGAVERLEAPLQAVARELQEETSICLATSKIRLVHEAFIGDTWHYLVFRGQLPPAEPMIQLSWEHDEYSWLSAIQLLDQPIPAGVDDYYLTALDYIRSTRTE